MPTQQRKATFIQQSRAVPASEKAAFHQITGAGKSHVKREFFGLSPADEQAIVDRIDQYLAQAVRQV